MTDDTRLARAKLLDEVDIVEGIRSGRLVKKIETMKTHTRSDNVVAALAASTITVVVLHLKVCLVR